MCFSAAMLDPRTLAERRDEVADSVRRRRMRVDLDGAIAAYEQVARLRGALDDVNRLRNEHQKSAQKKMEAAERCDRAANEILERLSRNTRDPGLLAGLQLQLRGLREL